MSDEDKLNIILKSYDKELFVIHGGSDKMLLPSNCILGCINIDLCSLLLKNQCLDIYCTLLSSCE